MKEAILLATLALALYFYTRDSAPTPAPATKAPVAVVAPARATATFVAPAPSTYSRWKTGVNAQTEFEPFAPNEQATWNQNPVYTIVVRGH